MSKLSDIIKHRKHKSDSVNIEKFNTVVKDKTILRFAGYHIGRKLDSGTFATVRYAEKEGINGTIPLAVKVIDKAKASPLFTKKFLIRELAIWPKLNHRHIIQVEDIKIIQERVYVFMELASRGSVIEYLQANGAVTEDLGRNWCKRMCQALRYCHNRGVAHRDLKCDNLLLDKDLQIKIGDFGFCCRSVDRLSGEAILSETYCGSSSYVAPEVIASKPYNPIPADVWSAGVCIYVILNNAMPFDDTNIARMYEDQLRRRWRFSSEAEPRLSSAAKRLIMRMLQPEVEKRPTIDQVLNSTWMRSSIAAVTSGISDIRPPKVQ